MAVNKYMNMAVLATRTAHTIDRVTGGEEDLSKIAF